MRALLAACVLLMVVVSGCSSPPSSTSTASTSSTAATATTPATVTYTTTTTATNTATGTSASTTTTTSTTSTTSTSTTTTSQGPSDVAAPVIEDVIVTVLGPSSIRVAWTVNDESSVTSQVEYATAANFATTPLRTASQSGSGEKTQDITGLSSCTTYRVRIYAKDVYDHEVVSAPSIDVTTTGPAPAVTGVTVLNIMHDSFTVRWNVSGAPDTQSQIQFGTTSAYGQTTPLQFGTGTKTAVVSGLTGNTDYNYRVSASNPCGGLMTPNAIQKTARLVTVTINAPAIPGGQATFSPGGTTNPVAVTAGRPIVFEIKNMDSVQHNWNIDGATPAYGSGNIGAGLTFTMPTSITFTAGDHTMKCTIHNMTGTVRAT